MPIEIRELVIRAVVTGSDSRPVLAPPARETAAPVVDVDAIVAEVLRVLRDEADR